MTNATGPVVFQINQPCGECGAWIQVLYSPVDPETREVRLTVTHDDDGGHGLRLAVQNIDRVDA